MSRWAIRRWDIGPGKGRFAGAVSQRHPGRPLCCGQVTGGPRRRLGAMLYASTVTWPRRAVQGALPLNHLDVLDASDPTRSRGSALSARPSVPSSGALPEVHRDEMFRRLVEGVSD